MADTMFFACRAGLNSSPIPARRASPRVILNTTDSTTIGVVVFKDVSSKALLVTQQMEMHAIGPLCYGSSNLSNFGANWRAWTVPSVNACCSSEEKEHNSIPAAFPSKLHRPQHFIQCSVFKVPLGGVPESNMRTEPLVKVGDSLPRQGSQFAIRSWTCLGLLRVRLCGLSSPRRASCDQ